MLDFSMIYWARLQKRLNNFGSGKENIQQKITQQRLLKIFWKIYIKFLKFSKYFIKLIVKFKNKLRKNLRKFENFY